MTITEQVQDLERRYSEKCNEVAKLLNQVQSLRVELQGTRDALNKHAESETAKDDELARAKSDNDRLKGIVAAKDKRMSEMSGLLSSIADDNPVVEAVSALPTWKVSDIYRFKGSETESLLFCVKSLMEDKGIDTAKEFENLLESAQDCRELKQKLNDMVDAINDWTNDMPSIDPDDY